ncbi:MAG: phosphoserine phosphatase SerB [Helicobacteraceae bacterium]|jgi:phosphoserine phosphatase|nr:phosphoserine phosphatase SerB [Helicobacteraceae bacterium]
MKLCAFDFDSTLMDGETIDALAAAFGKGEEIAAITREAMNGELDFFEAITRRAIALKGMPCSKAAHICENLPLMNGAIECVRELRRRGYTIVIFSGGFHIGVDPAAEKLGAHAAFANVLRCKNGVLTGEVGGEMLFDFSKGEMLRRVQSLLGVGAEDTIAVGDGANDRAMFQRAATKIAFCAKAVLKKEANVIIDEKDLRLVLKHISG